MKLSAIFILLFILSSCTPKSDVDLYTDAKAAEGKKDFQKASEIYEQIVDQFSTTAYAETSLLHLSVIYNNDLKDSRKAIHSYQRYYTMFPTSKQAPTMLFLSGFIYNNDLHQLDSARTVYETFLKKYPDHELAASARFELETLGKDPSQTLNPQTADVDDSKNKPVKKALKK